MTRKRARALTHLHFAQGLGKLLDDALLVGSGQSHDDRVQRHGRVIVRRAHAIRSARRRRERPEHCAPRMRPRNRTGGHNFFSRHMRRKKGAGERRAKKIEKRDKTPTLRGRGDNSGAERSNRSTRGKPRRSGGDHRLAERARTRAKCVLEHPLQLKKRTGRLEHEHYLLSFYSHTLLFPSCGKNVRAWGRNSRMQQQLLRVLRRPLPPHPGARFPE